MPRKRKPKFRVGQVVYYKTRKVWVKITDSPPIDRFYYFTGYPEEAWAHESELRPLTHKEMGR